tara:strand:- start:133 stop:657 length:525 start_codon:yes stop_codon:yes gene_type:complete
MPPQKDLLIITASNGENLKLAERFVHIAKQLGEESDLLDLTCLELPIFNPRIQNETGIPTIVKSLNNQMASIPRWIICAPEYNGSIPPILTSAIAWLSVQESDFRNLFNGRPIALASFSGGGCMELLVSMRIQLSHLGAQVVGRQLTSNKNKPATDEAITDLIKRLTQMNSLTL